MSLARSGYFLAFGSLSIFFIYHLIIGRTFSQTIDKEMTKSLLFAVGCLTLFITKTDKPYLIRSIPLRMMMGTSAALGLAALATVVGPY